jgi:rhodanese-related sulfurtransferase
MNDASRPEIDTDEAIALIAGGAYLLDVREQNEWDAVHAPAAVLLPMSVIHERVDEVPADRTVYVVCHSGARSAKVAAFLRSEGIDAVNVAGGMLAWQAAGGEVVASSAT